MIGSPTTAQQNADVLRVDDDTAYRLLHDMAAKGDLSTPGHAAAWVAISSVALGVGLEQCAFAQPESTVFLVRPALDGMSEEQIIVLNRMITANFREAESSGSNFLESLYPITRQSVAFLGWENGRLDCRLVADIWDVALNYAARRD